MLLGLVTVGGRAVIDDITEVKLTVFQPYFSAIHLCVVKDVVDDGQQVFGRLPGRFQIIPLPACQWFFFNEVDHPQNPVKWGAKFVTHGRKKLGFCLVGCYRPLAGRL